MQNLTQSGAPPGSGPEFGSPWTNGLTQNQETVLSPALTDFSGITARSRLLAPQAIALSSSNTVFQNSPLAVAPLTAELNIVLQRPTTLVPQNWDSSSTLRITLVYTVDGIAYNCVGQATGGIRLNLLGAEVGEYKLTFRPPTRRIAGVWKRLGEDASTRAAHVRLEWLSGTIETTLLVAESAEVPAPVEV